MKELVFKRQNELEEIYRGVHMDVDSDAARQILSRLIDSGLNDPQIFWLLIYSFKNIYKKNYNGETALENMIVVHMA